MEFFRWIGHRVVVAWQFEPRDVWVGMYWERIKGTTSDDGIKFWICVVPMFPLMVYVAEDRER